MLEHLDERARRSVALAQDEARRIGHEEIGTVHLLLGVAGVVPELLGVEIRAVRAAVVALQGSGAPAGQAPVSPFSAEAKAALEGANRQALGLGHTVIDPAHLLLALLDAGGGAARALREAGATPGDVRERAIASAGRSAGPVEAGAAQPAEPATAATAAAPHADHARDLRNGRPVPVTLGADVLPLGDLGQPRVDAHLLELMLVGDTAAGRLLRDSGIDEARLRTVLGPRSDPG